MLTTDKTITTPAFWDSVYNGERNGAKVDASDTKRTSTFDRFQIVVNHAEGNKILGVGSGHAHTEKRIKAKFPDALVIASDQSHEARHVANYSPYIICDAYDIPFLDKELDLVIATQCLEYMEFQDKFLKEAQRVSKKFICTIPLGSMKSWSQLFIYNEDDFCKWLENYGVIEVKENYGEILLVKINFNE